nr:unnamed protein product [Callosobruchus chinensis]
MKEAKFIFITGGVVSSLGKGLVASSVGALLQAYGFRISIRKLDPYLNIDPGTMNPTQHGELFVTEDGVETDLDLGHYERFTGIKATKGDNITTGGTVGDIESQPFLEAIRQVNYTLGKQRVILIHLTLIPYLTAAQQLKKIPTQHSVRELNSAGLQPDIILCRKKIAKLCNVSLSNVIPAPDVSHIYELPVLYSQCGLDKQILEHFHLSEPKPSLIEWDQIVHSIRHPTQEVTVSIVGKYTEFRHAYKSLVEALNHSTISNKVQVKINWVNSREKGEKPINEKLIGEKLQNSMQFLFQGAINYARINNIPFFGICLGIQGLSKKVNSLEIVLDEYKPDFMCITEHWLKAHEINTISIHNYEIVNSFCRKTYDRGGVCIFSKIGLELQPINFITVNIQSLSSLAIRMTILVEP